MKNKKFLIIVLILMSLTIGLYLVTGDAKIQVDSGFDSSYDSGSSSSSDWSSSNYNSSYSTPLSNTEEVIVAMPFILFMIGIYVYAFIEIKKAIETRIKEIEKEKEKTKKYIADNKINVEKLNEELFNIYKDVQEAWMDFDYDKMRKLVSDEMYNMYKSQLETLSLSNQKNIMKNIKFISCDILNIEENEENISLKVNLKVKCYDYIINTNTNKVVRGNKNKYWSYDYNITYIKNKKIKENCPNCGKKLSKDDSSKCNSCGSTITNNQKDWVMSKKTMNYQS